MDTDLGLLRSGHPEDVGRFHDRHVDAVDDWFEPRVHDPDDVADLTAETFAAALIDRRSAHEPVRAWLLGHAERQLAAYRRRGDAERRMRRRLGMKDGHLRKELVAAAERGLPTFALPSARAILVTAAGAALAVILVVAFTGGRQDDQRTASRPTSAPAADRQLFGGSLTPGVRYRDPSFIPALSFVVGDAEWFAGETGATAYLSLQRRNRVAGRPGSERPPTQFLVFARFTEVYDPEQRGLTGSLVPAPADVAAWLAEHPDVTVGPAEPVTVAGVPGEALPATVRFKRPAHRDPECNALRREGCTAIAPGLSLFSGTRMRVILLRTEPDPMVIALIATRRGDLDALEEAAAPVLDSLRIGVE